MFGLSHTSVGVKSGAAITAAAFADCDDEDESGAGADADAAYEDEVDDEAEDEEDEDDGGSREPRRIPSTRGSISAKSASSAGPAARKETIFFPLTFPLVLSLVRPSSLALPLAWL